MVNSSLDSLIPAIVSHVVDAGGFITKTKLLKLLYLFDVEYYRVHRRTYTGLDWEYFHLGPWTQEYDPLIEKLFDKSILFKTPSFNSDYDTEFYKAGKQMQIKDALPDFKDESIIRRILNTWGDKKTSQILDYVYFQTEPILQGERYKRLDFSMIPEEPIPQYRRSSSGKTKQQIKAIRKAFEDKQKANPSASPRSQFTTPTKYDEEYWEAMDTLEELAR